MESITIHIRGAVASKKDKLRPRRDGNGGKGYRYDGEISSNINGVVLQIRAAWRNRRPVEHPNITVLFRFSGLRRDRDGRLATILDALKVAGVIRDDNVAHCNGHINMPPAVIDRKAEEGCEVTICVNN